MTPERDRLLISSHPADGDPTPRLRAALAALGADPTACKAATTHAIRHGLAQSVEPGATYWRNVLHHLDRAHTLVLLLAEDGVLAEIQHHEARAALDRSVPVEAVVMRGDGSAEVVADDARYQRNEIGDPDAFARLIPADYTAAKPTAEPAAKVEQAPKVHLLNRRILG